MEACQDCKEMKGYDDEPAMVVALRNRLKGTAWEVSDANREFKKGENGQVINFFQILKDNFKEDKQKNSERVYE